MTEVINNSSWQNAMRDIMSPTQTINNVNVPITIDIGNKEMENTEIDQKLGDDLRSCRRSKEELQRDISRLEEDISVKSSRITELELVIQQNKTEDSTEILGGDIVIETVTNDSEMKELKESISQERLKVRQLERELKKATEENNELKENNEDLDKSNTDLVESNQELIEEVGKLDGSLTRIQNLMDELKIALSGDKTMEESRILELTKELKNEVDVSEIRAQTLEEQNSSLSSQIERLEAEESDNERLHILTENLISVRRDLSSAKKQIKLVTLKGDIPSKNPVYTPTLKGDIPPQNSHSLRCSFSSLPSLKNIKSDKDIFNNIFNKRDYEINRQMELFRAKLNEKKITNLKEQWDMFNQISHLFSSKQIEYVKYIKAIESIDIIIKTCKTSKN